ncbi:hypothetical protein ES703_120600 [subsurface metagenome]
MALSPPLTDWRLPFYLEERFVLELICYARYGREAMKHILIIVLLLSLALGTGGCLAVVPQQPASSPTADTPADYAPAPAIDPTWSPPLLENSAPTLPSIADVVEKAYPTVVTIQKWHHRDQQPCG